MKKEYIHFKKKLTKKKPLKYDYIILLGTKPIGEITYKKKNNIFILRHLWIYPEYQDNHYGYKVIEYILTHYKISCIIGESLPQSRIFWDKCINKFNGQKREVTYCENCVWSFVIPCQEINNKKIYELLCGK